MSRSVSRKSYMFTCQWFNRVHHPYIVQWCPKPFTVQFLPMCGEANPRKVPTHAAASTLASLLGLTLSLPFYLRHERVQYRQSWTLLDRWHNAYHSISYSRPPIGVFAPGLHC
ncbi:hypothetical protein BDR03DRAFT_963162 [Suillus americanus]|nr:hypothetical protein BDR03DRAFT_963162 [Suillus americanus]